MQQEHAECEKGEAGAHPPPTHTHTPRLSFLTLGLVWGQVQSHEFADGMTIGPSPFLGASQGEACWTTSCVLPGWEMFGDIGVSLPSVVSSWRREGGGVTSAACPGVWQKKKREHLALGPIPSPPLPFRGQELD